jgi:acetyl-CoA synthetase
MGTFAWEPSAELMAGTTLAAFLANHGLADLQELQRRADGDPQWYWDALIRHFDIRFDTPYSQVLDESAGVEWPRWCVGGTTNISWNCLSRHRGTDRWDADAVVWEGEDERVVRWSFARLDAEVARLAALLESKGVGKGDVVGLYLPMVPEAVAAFLATVEIGAIVMPLFSGFGRLPLADRLADSGAKAIVTCPSFRRRGKDVPMHQTALDAAETSPGLQHVILLDRNGDASTASPLDTIWSTVEAPEPRSREPQMFDAETPAMLMYTSGTTGKPKGTVHTHCGMLTKNALDMGLCLDVKAGDSLIWMSDMGWIVGPKISIGCTLLGATLVMAEGTPDWPQHNRIWGLCERHGVSVAGIVPTAVRQMMRTGADPLEGGLKLERLRTIISSGEPWTPEAWTWFFDTVCRRRVPILNYSGGTECGGAILIGTHHRPLRPCSFGGPVPGGGVEIVDASGASLPDGEVGELVLRRPTIGATRGLWKDPERYVESYWRQIEGAWVQGDLASRDADGLWYLHGRSDDTIKLAGKRTGPSELEAALMATGLVADVAVVGIPDAIAGSALLCVCVVSNPDAEGLTKQLSDALARDFGAPYRPKKIVFASDLPRTRNQKVMRRVIRSIALGQPTGDLTSLANPDSVDELQNAFGAFASSHEAGRPAGSSH